MTDMFDNLDPACVALAQAIIDNPTLPLTYDMAACLDQITNQLGYDERFKEYLFGSEGSPDNPYPDPKGFVTGGEGHKFTSREEFVATPYYINGSGRPATVAEKEAGYDRLSAVGENNNRAKYYENITPLRMPREYATLLRDKDLLTRHHELNNGVVPNFDRMTAPMRRATMDVHFNAGMSQFPKARGFARELKKAEYCQSLHRLENNPNVRQRNEWTYNECMNGDFIR